MTQEDVLSGVLAAIPTAPAMPPMPITPPGMKNKIQLPALLPGLPVPPALPILLLPGMEKIPPPPGVKLLGEGDVIVAVGPALPKLPAMPGVPTPPGTPALPGVPAAVPIPEALPKEKLSEEEIAAILGVGEEELTTDLEAEVLAMGDGMVLTEDEEGLQKEELEL